MYHLDDVNATVLSNDSPLWIISTIDTTDKAFYVVCMVSSKNFSGLALFDWQALFY